MEDIDGTSVLVIERYDRRIDGKRVVRQHQEDLCQALGIRPVDKYQMGRPSERMARLLRRSADSPSKANRELFRQVAFRTVVGDEDGHGKNYSLLLDRGCVKLSPIYDSLCTLVYPELSGRMAVPIGPQSTLAKVDRKALLGEGVAMGLVHADAEVVLQGLAIDLKMAIEDLDSTLTSHWPSGPVIETVLGRVNRLESGEPMGGSASRSPKRTPRQGADMTTQTTPVHRLSRSGRAGSTKSPATMKLLNIDTSLGSLMGSRRIGSCSAPVPARYASAQVTDSRGLEGLSPKPFSPQPHTATAVTASRCMGLSAVVSRKCS